MDANNQLGFLLIFSNGLKEKKEADAIGPVFDPPVARSDKSRHFGVEFSTRTTIDWRIKILKFASVAVCCVCVECVGVLTVRIF